MLTKTQAKIMQLFTAQITELFSMRMIERVLKMNYSLVHRAVKPLVEKHKLLQSNKQNYLSLNYKENHDVLTFIEYRRRNEFFKKQRNKDLAMCLYDFVDKFKEENFVLLIFGSAVDKNNPNDIDLLLIVDSMDKTEPAELQLHNIGRSYGIENLHIIAVSYESVYEMFGLREQRNVMNEILNKHIIIHGAELFYRLVKRGRK